MYLSICVNICTTYVYVCTCKLSSVMYLFVRVYMYVGTYVYICFHTYLNVIFVQVRQEDC